MDCFHFNRPLTTRTTDFECSRDSRNRLIKIVFIAISGGLLSMPLSTVAESTYSPHADWEYPTRVYWGDTHLHTNLSVDVDSANLTDPMGMGISSEQAYRFARGEVVTAQNGMPFRLQRPLDFLVIADHAENLGLITSTIASNPVLLESDSGRDLIEQYQTALGNKDKLAALSKALYSQYGFSQQFSDNNRLLTSVWNEVIRSADQHNDPGRFTAFIGYEWSSMAFNLHRVVIFKDNSNFAQKVLPYSQFDSNKPEDLWMYLEGYEQKTGGEVLAIPHNGNLSQGHMFSLRDSENRPMTKVYAKARSRWEPLYEVTQIKGDSETHPAISPNDEFADFETWRSFWEVKAEDSNRTYEYARSALKLGLKQQSTLGVNPFKFGMVGSTDAHGSLSAITEDNYLGKGAWTEPSHQRVTMEAYKSGTYKGKRSRVIAGWELNASGYAAIWAEENTRDSLFAAMKRKEVYATTGPRITVRFFGGWGYQPDDALKPNLARIGYNKGVPMGGDLTHAPEGKSPNFLIRATKDPDGANLDRVQVIKGWHDAAGELHEKIYNVALSDGRKENWGGKVKPVGNTVNVPDASYTNSIGGPELAVVWTDPNFNKDELAFYYVRVLEIPTPRWTAYDAKFFVLNDLPKPIPMMTQERAYTSPIWYTPIP